jgi:small subunit ribosomal protein S6
LRNYELMWVLGGQATDADGAASIERLKSLVAARGGQVQKAEFWGKRTLSFPILHNREGSYYVARFSVEGIRAPEIEAAFLADQAVIRHMMVRAEEVEEAEQQPRPEAKEPSPAAASA